MQCLQPLQRHLDPSPSINSTSSSPSPTIRDSSLSAPPAEPQRSRSFSLLQNIPIPFTSRPTPLRASTTQADITSARMTKSPNTNDLPAEIVINIETYTRVRVPLILGSLNKSLHRHIQHHSHLIKFPIFFNLFILVHLIFFQHSFHLLHRQQ